MRSIFAPLAAFLAASFALVSSAQIQPQLVRPLNGACDPSTGACAFPAFTNVNMSTGSFPQTSVVVSMTTYSTALVTVDITGSGPSCAKKLGVSILGSTSPTGNFTIALDDTSLRSFDLVGTYTYLVGNLPSYAKVQISTTAAAGAVVCSATVNVLQLAFPNKVQAVGAFTQGETATVTRPVLIGGEDGSFVVRTLQTDALGRLLVTTLSTNNYVLPATTPISVGATATLVFTAGSYPSGQQSVTLQSVGTVPVVCAVGTSAGSVTTSRYSFALAASTSAGDGTGGSVPIPNLKLGDLVFCVRNGATDGKVAILPH